MLKYRRIGKLKDWKIGKLMSPETLPPVGMGVEGVEKLKN
jgi:hypothetical protein